MTCARDPPPQERAACGSVLDPRADCRGRRAGSAVRDGARHDRQGLRDRLLRGRGDHHRGNTRARLTSTRSSGSMATSRSTADRGPQQRRPRARLGLRSERRRDPRQRSGRDRDPRRGRRPSVGRRPRRHRPDERRRHVQPEHHRQPGTIRAVSGDATIKCAKFTSSAGTASSKKARVFYKVEVIEADTDGDALPDSWETRGLDTERATRPSTSTCPRIGANPSREDVFVEVDCLASAGATPTVDELDHFGRPQKSRSATSC